MLGKLIKKYRNSKKWSQEKLAQESGVAYSIITKLEQEVIKEPTIQTVRKLAEAFDISVDELIGRKRKKKKQGGL
ncbi:helix-turn-helix domain-containing protein [bacterium]